MPILPEHPSFITVTQGMRGWFAVQMCWNPEHGGFYEPWITSPMSHKTRDEAINEAQNWAKLEGFKFVLKGQKPLTFDQLRAANIQRLPLFVNKHGQFAHSEPDGSDWSDAQWLEAVVGEIGEYANLHKKLVRGDVDYPTFIKEAAKELADIQTYLDILAFRLGVDLGEATRSKFNEVSKRVGCEVML